MGRAGLSFRRAGRLSRVAALAAMLVAAPLAAPAPAGTRPGRYESVLAPADSMAVHGHAERAEAYADSLVRFAQERGDRALEAAVAARRVINWVGAGRFDDGVREAQRVAALARTERDTLSWCRALLAEGRAQLFRDRLAESAPPYRRMLPLARAIGDPLLEGNARLGLAYLDLRANLVSRAETGYRRAIGLLERTPDLRSEMTARVGLARVLREQGRWPEARRSYERILERCRATGDRVNEADAWNNLGALDAAAGSPAKAARNFGRALRISRELRRSSPMEVRNLAILLVEAGRADAAADSLEHELALWPRGAWRQVYALRTQLAIVRGLQGRQAETERILGEQWAARDSVPLELAADAAVQLVIALERDGRVPEARSLALELDRMGAGRLPASTEVARVIQLAKLDRQAGRPGDALERLKRLRPAVAPEGAGEWKDAISFDLAFSRTFHALGMPDSAIAAAARASDRWERTAAGVRDAEWFEPIGNSAAQLAIETARNLLDPRRPLPEDRRAREAFDAVQRFKSRALEWRASGGVGRGAALVTVAELQRHVLRPAEVFVDAYASLADSILVFVVDRDAVGVHWVGSLGEDEMGLTRLLLLLRSGEASSAPYQPAAARQLAAGLFGPTLERLRRSHRVVSCLSGLLNAVPLAALPADTLGGPPLMEGRSLVSVPSASWLARRRREGAVSVEAAAVVTVARTTDDRGRALAGVAEETRWLAARYGGAGIVHAGDRPLSAVLPWISRGDILHVSSHARVSMNDPWSCAFLLGRGEDEDAWLSAREIASRRRPCRLAVLASCRSTLDRGFNNESVLGLARAFLAAGVPTVLSTLWPVDDRATAAFTRRFYLGLEQGQTAADALRQAQAETRRAAPTSAPYYWAGFTLSGDPDTRVRPRRAR